MTVTETQKDIGMIFDRNLSSDVHIIEGINMANTILGKILRSFEFTAINKLLFLY